MSLQNIRYRMISHNEIAMRNGGISRGQNRGILKNLHGAHINWIAPIASSHPGPPISSFFRWISTLGHVIRDYHQVDTKDAIGQKKNSYINTDLGS